MTIHMKKGNKIVKALKRDAIAAALVAGTIIGGMLLMLPQLPSVTCVAVSTEEYIEAANAAIKFCMKWFRGNFPIDNAADKDEFWREFYSLNGLVMSCVIDEIRYTRSLDVPNDVRDRMIDYYNMEGYIIY